mgnify:CR=1 FL=1
MKSKDHILIVGASDRTKKIVRPLSAVNVRYSCFNYNSKSDIYKLLKKIHDTLTIIKSNTNIYGEAQTYSEYLMGSNLELYQRLTEVVPALDVEDPQSYEMTSYDENKIF